MVKAFIKGYPEIVNKILKHIEKALNAATTDPVQAEQHWRNACEETEKSSSGVTRAEIKEHVIKQMKSLGMDKETVELFTQKWDVMDLMDKGTKLGPKIVLGAKTLGLILSTVVVGIIGIFASIGGHEDGQDLKSVLDRNDFVTEQSEYMLKLSVSTDEFLQMVQGYNIRLDDSIRLDQNYVPPPKAMPAAVEAVAALPVKVDIEYKGSVRNATTTVGQVYRTVPQARQTIENHASAIQHDYDKPDVTWPNRLHAIFNPPERNQIHRVNIDVDAGFASAHIHM